MERFIREQAFFHTGCLINLGQNATFVYTVCASTIEAWASSFISAILALPDPAITEVADATHPMATLGIAVAASVLTALALAPLDIIRTKFATYMALELIR